VANAFHSTPHVQWSGGVAIPLIILFKSQSFYYKSY
jgi:hypothetical protein